MTARKGRPGEELLPLPVITASEIGEYAYCARAWWYRHVVRISPPAAGAQGRLAAGVRAHKRHGSLVSASTRLQAAGVALALLGGLVLCAALLLSR